MNPADPIFDAAVVDLHNAELACERYPQLAAPLANALADKWQKNGLLRRWLVQYFDQLLDAEELEFNGRWCDDGGRAEEDEP